MERRGAPNGSTAAVLQMVAQIGSVLERWKRWRRQWLIKCSPHTLCRPKSGLLSPPSLLLTFNTHPSAQSRTLIRDPYMYKARESRHGARTHIPTRGSWREQTEKEEGGIEKTRAACFRSVPLRHADFLCLCVCLFSLSCLPVSCLHYTQFSVLLR